MHIVSTLICTSNTSYTTVLEEKIVLVQLLLVIGDAT